MFALSRPIDIKKPNSSYFYLKSEHNWVFVTQLYLDLHIHELFNFCATMNIFYFPTYQPNEPCVRVGQSFKGSLTEEWGYTNSMWNLHTKYSLNTGTCTTKHKVIDYHELRNVSLKEMFTQCKHRMNNQLKMENETFAWNCDHGVLQFTFERWRLHIPHLAVSIH